MFILLPSILCDIIVIYTNRHMWVTQVLNLETICGLCGWSRITYNKELSKYKKTKTSSINNMAYGIILCIVKTLRLQNFFLEGGGK